MDARSSTSKAHSRCTSPRQCAASNSSVASAFLHPFSCGISCTARSLICTGFPIFPMIRHWRSRRGGAFANNCWSPCKSTFGRLAIRSAYRAPAVNAFGNAHRLSCASNERNYALVTANWRGCEGDRGARGRSSQRDLLSPRPITLGYHRGSTSKWHVAAG